MTESKHGGPGRGQGRKPLADDAPSVVFTMRLTPAQRDRLRDLGGGVWLRSMIDLARSSTTQKSVECEVTKYWRDNYMEGHCTLCGNRGLIDTRGTKTMAGVDVGRVNYCICPNGQALRASKNGVRPRLLRRST